MSSLLSRFKAYEDRKKTPTPSPESEGDQIIKWGTKKNMSFKDVFETDHDYVKWCCSHLETSGGGQADIQENKKNFLNYIETRIRQDERARGQDWLLVSDDREMPNRIEHLEAKVQDLSEKLEGLQQVLNDILDLMHKRDK